MMIERFRFLSKAALLAAFLPIILSGTRADAKILYEATDSYGNARENYSKNKSKNCADIDLTTEKVRKGSKAFKHSVTPNKECARAETYMPRLYDQEEVWFGWSMYMPKNYLNETRHKVNIVMQMSGWPKVNGKGANGLPCRGVGHKLKVIDGMLTYTLQSAKTGDKRALVKENDLAVCRNFPLLPVSDLVDQWTDIVVHGKWVGTPDGFLEVWMRTGNSPYKKVLDYKGATWWDFIDWAPQLKIGVYEGTTDWYYMNGSKAPRVLYTDEIRIGDKNSSFSEVAPSGNIPREQSTNTKPKDSTEDDSSSRSEPSITFRLMDKTAEKTLRSLKENDSLTLRQRVNIIADVKGLSNISRVEVFFDGVKRTEKRPPYKVFVDKNIGKEIKPGKHTVKAIVYGNNGKKLAEKSLSFTIKK